MKNTREQVIHFLAVSRMRAEVYGYAPDMDAARNALVKLARKFPATMEALVAFVEMMGNDRDSDRATLHRAEDILRGLTN